MSSHRQEAVRRLTAPDIAARKGGKPIVCLTAYTAPMAEILDEHCDLLLVGDSVGMVVHGLDGMDEISTTGTTLVAEIKDGAVRMQDLTPERMGVPRAKLDDLRGGTVAENAAAMTRLLGYLADDCCGGRPEICAPLTSLAKCCA